MASATEVENAPGHIYLVIRRTVDEEQQQSSDDRSHILVHKGTSTKRALVKVPKEENDHRSQALQLVQDTLGSVEDDLLQRLFAFQLDDDHDGGGGGELFEYQETIQRSSDLPTAQAFELVSMKDMYQWVDSIPEEDDDHTIALRLYLQRQQDLQVNRRLLHGYSSGNLDQYGLRPKPTVVFFDCDDCLYFDGWSTAKRLSKKIDEWCVAHGLPQGKAYQLYKEYGTALRGLRAEGYIENSDAAIDQFLEEVHDISVDTLLQPDPQLRAMILRMDPSIPRYIFTASVRHHAERCLTALGIADLFVDIIDCKRCDLETKHSPHSFQAAMQVANVTEPESCVFLDDSTKNIKAAREIGWRSVLVGRVGRDCGTAISSDHAELEIDRIHHMEDVLPELFLT